MTPHLTLVVAVAKNGVIGRDGDLPWRISSDMKRFKAATMALCSLAFFCCGRISRNHITMKMRMNGANDMSMSVPLAGAPAACAQASEMNMN